MARGSHLTLDNLQPDPWNNLLICCYLGKWAYTRISAVGLLPEALRVLAGGGGVVKMLAAEQARPYVRSTSSYTMQYHKSQHGTRIQ